MRPAKNWLLHGSIIAAFFVIACGAPDPEPPTAVITADPETVPLGDNHQTVITLDAYNSAPRLSLVPVPPDPDEPPLDYEWSLSGAEHRIISGAMNEPELQVTIKGDRPLHVELTVRNDEGGVAASLKTISVTRTDEGATE